MSKVRIFVAGHNGMVGSGLVRGLKKIKKNHILTIDKKKLNLTNQANVKKFFMNNKIDQVYLAAAKVGGIFANNKFPYEFIYNNLMIQNNVIHSAFLTGVKKLLFLGSSCIYPRKAKQPIKEDMLLTGSLERTNEAYAIAKIAGIKLCESINRQFGISHGMDYRSIMPTNLYGPGDNYHPKNSHVIPGLIYRFYQAKKKKLPSVKIWGSGRPKREFLFIDDMVEASIHIMNIDKKIYEKYTNPQSRHINIGSGEELSIYKLSKIIKKIVGYKGKIKFDTSMPDGSPQKLLNSKLLNRLGFKSKISLEEGLIKTYKSFIKSLN